MSYTCLQAPATCDGCNGFGTTCQVIESRSLIETAASFHRLRDSITEEAESGLSLARLIKIEVSVRCGADSAPAALPPAPEPVDIFDVSQEEAQHVAAARPLR